MSVFKEIFNIFTVSPFTITALISSAALMLVNGWTDAPVNIATAIHSKAIRPNTAIFMSAICNFLGAAAMCVTGSSVAVSIYSISGLSAVGSSALPALTAAVSAVVVWALAALFFGLPTSESHSLTAALTGAAVAVAGIDSVNTAEWLKVLIGLVLSTLPVAVISFFAARYTQDRFSSDRGTFRKLQVFGAMLSSFAHGAQDGQKFAGILALNIALAQSKTDSVTVPVWTTAVSASIISLGTLLGGRKIIKRFETFAPKDPSAGFMSDLVSATSLLILSVLGVPASTTHAKSSAVIGAGATHTPLKQTLKTCKGMLAAWVLTFPVSAALGYVFTVIFLLFR